MKNPISTLPAGIAGALLLAFPFIPEAAPDDGGAPPDEPAKAHEEPDDGPMRPEEVFGSPDPNQALQEEMKELFHKVERTLKSIDVELADAGAGFAPLDEVADSGLDDLLRSAESNSDQVVSDIDRILEIAEQMGGGT